MHCTKLDSSTLHCSALISVYTVADQGITQPNVWPWPHHITSASHTDVVFPVLDLTINIFLVIFFGSPNNIVVNWPQPQNNC